MTPQEVKLWSQLRHLNRTDHHFRRQAPVDGYILDFVDLGHRLIIEVDGSQHGIGTGQIRDERRDRHFIEAGFRVLRFWNIDIDSALDGVMFKILETLRQDPHPRPSGGPSPQRGRDEE